ncbi:hypothetical protein [Pedobacter punctiformis]|uniref:Uncharacterized protein n=1 Tax=Pedobacter punctiformis TaxID=3004097 RepID=A0ABT4L6Q0_9SPHI|nr:hypothetical protein [Pedobacter sp. HCMS5-2]MCZ4243597.1 hypothetical protein [Pedobacter sp. HCMS5-2]
MKDLINTEIGELYFGNQEYISAKTTFEELKNMKGTIDHSFEALETGIQNLSFFNKEIDGKSYMISVHFDFQKLVMIFIRFDDGKQLIESPLWNQMKPLKKDNHTKHLHKKMFTKEKKYDWGKLHAFYSPKTNLGMIDITYKI